MAHDTSLTIDQSFGAAVARLRTTRGLSQRGLALRLEELGMPADASAISRIEAGSRSIRLSELSTIAEALDVDPVLLVASGRSSSALLEALRLGEDARDRVEASVETFMLAQVAVAGAADAANPDETAARRASVLLTTDLFTLVGSAMRGFMDQPADEGAPGSRLHALRRFWDANS